MSYATFSWLHGLSDAVTHMRSLIKARGTICVSKGCRTWPNEGTKPVKSQSANKTPKISDLGISQTPCFSASGQYNLIQLSLGLLWILQLLSVKTSGCGQRSVVLVGRRWQGSCVGCRKPKASFVAPGLVIISPVCAFLVSSVWSKASKRLQNGGVHLRSERFSLFYVRLLLLYLLVQIFSISCLSFSFEWLSGYKPINALFPRDKTHHFLSQKNECYSDLILLLYPFPAVLFSYFHH